jgi:hypothetical protein
MHQQVRFWHYNQIKKRNGLTEPIKYAAGSVNTAWKQGTGSSSAGRAASRSMAADHWALRAIAVAAAVIGDTPVSAVLASLDMTAKHRRSRSGCHIADGHIVDHAPT